MTRRMVLRNVWIMFFAMVLIAALPFHAQSKTSYPEKPVQVLVGYGPGGGTDQVARAYCELMSKELGKKFLVINLPGAASANSINGLMEADPDGYTLLCIPSTISMLPTLGYVKYTYADMQPIGTLDMGMPLLIVKKDSKFKTAEDFFNEAKKNPGKLKVGTAYAGGQFHLALLDLVKKANINVIVLPTAHGGSGLNASLLGGHVDAIYCDANEAISQLKAGIFIALASSGTERSPYLKDVPTFKEIGINFSSAPLRGVLAPKGLPEDVLKILVDTTQKVVNSPKWNEFTGNTYRISHWIGPKDYEQYLKEELELYRVLLTEVGLADSKK